MASDGGVPSQDLATKEEILRILKERRNSYGRVMLDAVLFRGNDSWNIMLAKFEPIHRETNIMSMVNLDYGRFLICKKYLALDELESVINELISNRILKIDDNHSIKMHGGFEPLDPLWKYLPSGHEVPPLTWPSNVYHFKAKEQVSARGPLISLKLPLFPDLESSVRMYIGMNIDSYSQFRNSVLFIFPNYKAKISQVRLGSKQLTISVLSKEIKLEALIAKVYYEKFGDRIRQEEVLFDEQYKTISLDFTPDYVYIVLLSKEDEEMIDYRKINLRWPVQPEGVVLEVTSEDIETLARLGENERVEFKSQVKQPEKLAETVVAFSNGGGGMILMGVDDSGTIIGCQQEKLDETITKILRSHCEPPIQPEIQKHIVKEKDILAVRIKEGKDKPYIVKDRGVFVRVLKTDRIATRYELDQFYKK